MLKAQGFPRKTNPFLLAAVQILSKPIKNNCISYFLIEDIFEYGKDYYE